MHKPTLMDFFERYLTGMITFTELFIVIAKRAKDDDINPFIANCPNDLRTEIELLLADYGEDETAWPRTLCIESRIPGKNANEEADLRERDQKEIWDGVRILKQRFNK